VTSTGDVFVDGESCLLYGPKGRTFLVALVAGRTFHNDKGTVSHDDIIGSPEGVTLRSSTGTALVAMRPTHAEYVLNMKRGAAVMYPKDTSALVGWADIAPGCTVLEAGTGSGALTMALSRAVGPEGRIVTVERRQDHSTHAQRLLAAFRGVVPANIDFRTGDVEDVVAEVAPDRIVLDLPEPWTVVPGAAEHLAGGGALAAYLPTIPQVQQLREAMGESRSFVAVDTFEVLHRSWNIDGRSVRPDHRMVGHTGFITVGRRRLPKPPDASKGVSTDGDVS
jgi:tRNA (adenine57-N1/adenine58-N1)-methyltransferase